MKTKAELELELTSMKEDIYESSFKEEYAEKIQEILKDYYNHGDIDSLKKGIALSNDYLEMVVDERIDYLLDKAFS